MTDELNKMMDFLGYEAYMIPSHQIKLPIEAEGVNFRPTHLFKLHKDGSMTYYGSGMSGFKPDLEIKNITPSEAFLDRAHVFLSSEVRIKLKMIYGKSGIPDIERLLVKFNGLEFVCN